MEPVQLLTPPLLLVEVHLKGVEPLLIRVVLVVVAVLRLVLAVLVVRAQQDKETLEVMA
jgi:hypothetical protein